MSSTNEAIANDNLFNLKVTMQAMTELIKLLSEEIESLKTNQIKKISEFHNRKVDLIQYIENQNETLKKHPSITENFTSSEKLEMKNLAHKLQEVVSVNKVELEKAQYFNKELINLVVEAATGEGVDVRVYDKAGRKKKTSSQKVAPPSVSLNEKI